MKEKDPEKTEKGLEKKTSEKKVEEDMSEKKDPEEREAENVADEAAADNDDTEKDDEKTSVRSKAVKKSFIKKYGRAIVLLLIIALLAGGAFFIIRVNSAREDIKNAPMEEIRDVQRRTLRNYITVTATVEPTDKRTVSTLVSNTKVLDVNYKVGEYVHAGDVICTFDTSQITENITRLKKKMNVTTQKQNILMNDAQVDVNKAGTTWAYDNQDDLTAVTRKQTDYDRAVSEYYNATDGYSDAKKEKDSKSSARDSAKHKYDEAKEAWDTLTDEEKAGAVDLDEDKEAIKKTYEYFKGLYDAAESAYKAASSNVETYENNIRSKESAMITARNALEDANIKTPRDYIKDNVEVQLAQEKQLTAGLDASIANDENEKQMAEYNKELSNSVVTAPISGLITSMSVHPGDEFAEKTKSEVCVIQDDTGYIVKGNVNQYDISNVKNGMKALIKTEATGSEQLEGTLTFVSPVPASGTSGSSGSSGSNSTAASDSNKTKVQYPVEVKLNIRDSRLRLGMTAETSLVVDEKEDALCIPYDCIEEDENGNKYVNLVLKEDKDKKDEKKGLFDSILEYFSGEMPEPVRTEKIKVYTGIETNYYVEIVSSEIKEGDRIVVPVKGENDQSGPDMDTSDSDTGTGSIEDEGTPEDGEASEGDLSAGAGEI